jgi:glycosyltransferase involved in cell wall biosynthesis
MLKILHLVWAPYPEQNNGSTIRLFGILSRISHEIIMLIPNITMKGDILDPSEKTIGNIIVKTAPWSPRGIFTKSPLRYLYTLYKLPKKIVISAMSEVFDIIHVHDSPFFLQAAKKLSRRLNKPYIIEFHVVGMDYVTNINIPGTKVGIPFSGKIIGMFYERMVRDALTSCNHIITLTESLKFWISNYYGINEKDITVVPNGVDTDKFAPIYGKNAEDMKKELKLLKKIVLYSGFLDNVNGIDQFIKIIPSIISENPDISFLFIGHGPEEHNIISLSRKYPQVIFLPVVSYELMPTYYQMCDVFVIPRPSNISTETIVPLKLLEAMAMERPVLGSNVGGISEVITHGENGYLYKKDDIENFKKILLDILVIDNTQIGKNARETVVSSYSWDRSANILQTVYENLV